MAELVKKLAKWIVEKEANGIKQHSREWLDAKLFTVGGSSLAVIQGVNPYSDLRQFIRERIGLNPWSSNISMQWGNLFEDVIKRCVEHDYNCEILGEDLFVPGPEGTYTAYSPDGLAVADVGYGPEIVLMEFKCPYRRIPNNTIPGYYVPQIKMGLDLLGIPTRGLFAQAIFRRCSWDQLGPGPECDTTLVKSRGACKFPRAYGIIGFYYCPELFAKELKKSEQPEQLIALRQQLISEYENHFGAAGAADNDFETNDLGDCDPTLFTLIMNAYSKKILHPWYGSIVFTSKNDESGAAVEQINSDLENFINTCRVIHEATPAPSPPTTADQVLNFGILPWKLYNIYYTVVDKEENYLAPWLDKIKEVIGVIQTCMLPENCNKKESIIDEFVASQTIHFDD